MATKRYEHTVQLDSGLIVPAGAAAGKVLTSDGSGNLTLQTPATSQADNLQSGVMGNVASTGITVTINSSTRVPTWSQWPLNDVIWFLTGGTFIRGTMPAGPTAAFDAPAAGKWRYVAIDAVPGAYGAACTYLESSSADQTSAANAAAAPTSVTSGNIRIWDGIIANTAGVYSLVAGGTGINTIPAATGRDRRPWARGASVIQQDTVGRTTASTTLVPISSALAARVECTGVPVCLTLHASYMSNTAIANQEVIFVIDGSSIDARYTSTIPTGNYVASAHFQDIYTPAAGSHLWQPYFLVSAGTTTLAQNIYFTVEEMVRQNTANGTT